MRIFRHYTDLPADARATVAAFGNFDGVHLGHRAVIETAKRRADEMGRPLGVLTLEPHPRAFFSGRPLFRLTPPDIKAAAAASLTIFDMIPPASSGPDGTDVGGAVPYIVIRDWLSRRHA